MNNNQDRGFTGVWTPEYIFSNKELNANEKFLWSYIASFSGSRLKCCIQSNEVIAERMGVSERTITNGIKKLADLGFIFVYFKGKNSAKRQIFSVDEEPKKTAFRLNNDEGSKNCEPSEGGSKNCEEGSKSCDPTNRGEGSKSCDHRINKNKERINTADSTTADETPAESADNSWVDAVEERVQRSEIKAPAGYVVVDPNQEYTAKDLYGEKGDKKTAKTIADIKKQSWYTKYQKQEEVSPA